MAPRGPILPGPGVCSDLPVGRDVRVAAVHRLPAVVAVVIAARALRRVHGERNAAVQVLIGPAGHVSVGRFAGIQLRAGPKKQRAVGKTPQIRARRRARTYLPWFSVLCRRGFILRAGTSFWGGSFRVD